MMHVRNFRGGFSRFPRGKLPAKLPRMRDKLSLLVFLFLSSTTTFPFRQPGNGTVENYFAAQSKSQISLLTSRMMRDADPIAPVKHHGTVDEFTFYVIERKVTGPRIGAPDERDGGKEKIASGRRGDSDNVDWVCPALFRRPNESSDSHDFDEVLDLTAAADQYARTRRKRILQARYPGIGVTW